MYLFDNINIVIAALLRNEVSTIEFIVDISSKKSIKGFIYLAQALMIPGQMHRSINRTMFVSNLKSRLHDSDTRKDISLRNRVYIGVIPSPEEIRDIYESSGSIVILPDLETENPFEDKKIVFYNSDLDEAIHAISIYTSVNWPRFMFDSPNTILKKILDNKLARRYPFSHEAVYAYCAIATDSDCPKQGYLPEEPMPEVEPLLWGTMYVHESLTSRLMTLVGLTFCKDIGEFDQIVQKITSSFCTKELTRPELTIN